MDPLVFSPCKMQRGFLLLICASSLLRFTRLSDAADHHLDVECFSEDDLFIPGSNPAVTRSDCSQLLGPRPSAPSPADSFYDDTRIIDHIASSSGRPGLVNGNNLCYMNAFISSTFNIHCFRSTVYACEPENASTVMLAEVFAKLQTTKKTSVLTKFSLIPALEKEMDWPFGRWECILEFTCKLLDLFPDSVKKIFGITIRNESYLRSNDKLLKADNFSESHIIVPTTFSSLASAIQSHFPDNDLSNEYLINKEEFNEYRDIVEPFAEDKKYFPCYRKYVIVNCPEIMIFGIRRFDRITGFDKTLIELNFEITLPGLGEGSEPILYLLHAFCFHVPGHYMSYVREFTEESADGHWYRYDDSSVTSVRTAGDHKKLIEDANSSATLVFYVRADSIATKESIEQELQIPERIMKIANLMLTLEEVHDRKIELQREMKKASSKTVVDSLNGVMSTSPLFKTDRKDSGKKISRSDKLPELTRHSFSTIFPISGSYSLLFDSEEA